MRSTKAFVLSASICAGGFLMGAYAEAGMARSEFELQEVSAFGLKTVDRGFVRGQSGDVSEEPDQTMGAYPGFRSEHPLYGSVRFAREHDIKGSGVLYHFAVDESEGTGGGYDRLYLDLNRDLRLGEDDLLTPHPDPPAGGRLTYSSIATQIFFRCVSIPFRTDSGGEISCEILPRLAIYEEGYKSLCFVATKAREGRIDIAGQSYRAVLGHDYRVGGRYDLRDTALYLISPDDRNGRGQDWWGGDRLRAMHKIKDRYYHFSATPEGDRLFVHPYAGELGTFEVGCGSREIDKLAARGSFLSRDSAVAVGRTGENRPEPSRNCRLPVGDYRPSYLTVDFGRLRIGLSYNYHSDGKARERDDRPPVYGIAIRADKPYVLDFSNPPEVMFASPADGARVRAGEELEVKAVLTDPQLDIMIRGLDDTTRKMKREQDMPEGRTISYEIDFSLDPRVLVTRLDGEMVADGLMPFG